MITSEPDFLPLGFGLSELSFLRERVEIATSLVQKPLGLIPLFLQSLDDVRWSLLQEAGITQLALSVRDVLFVLRGFLFQPLALGGNVGQLAAVLPPLVIEKLREKQLRDGISPAGPDAPAT